MLADAWESLTEAGWITRQVAGALACVAEVHVVADKGPAGGPTADSVFVVHGSDAGSGPKRTASIVAEQVGAVGLVVAGYRWPAMADALDQLAPDLPVTVLALSRPVASDDADLVIRVLDRAGAVMVVTDGEREQLAALASQPHLVHSIGAPMAANPGALSEPDPLVAGMEYVLVRSDCAEDAADPAAELSRMLRLRYPGTTMAVSHHDSFAVWSRGRVQRVEPIQRSTDLDRLMAWSLVTVDLRPGPVFARRCVTSLLFGTPIVVPYDSRGREHAERGRGGLWFTNPAELAWCVESMWDGTIRDSLSAQGQAYAEQHFGSTDRFIARVMASCGLSSLPDPGTKSESEAETELVVP